MSGGQEGHAPSHARSLLMDVAGCPETRQANSAGGRGVSSDDGTPLSTSRAS